MRRDKDFMNISFLDFKRALSYISSITEDEFYIIRDILSKSGTLIDDVYEYIIHLDKCRKENIFEDSYIAVSTVNFMDTVKEIKHFIDGIRLDKKNKKKETDANLEESRRILENILDRKYEIEKAYSFLMQKLKDSDIAIDKLKNNELRIADIANVADNKKKIIDDLVQKSQVYTDTFTNQLQALKLRKDELNALLDGIDSEVKIRINNQLELYEKNLKDNVRGFNEKCESVFANNEKYFNDKREELLKNLSEEQATVTDAIEAFKQKVMRDLREIESSVYREKLSKYFYDERRKLKGDIDVNLIITSIFFFILYWKEELFKDYITNPDTIVKLGVSYFCFFVLAQIMFNVYSNYSCKDVIREILSLRHMTGKCSTYFKDCLDSNEKKGKDSIVKDSGLIEKLFFQKQLKELLTPYWCWLTATFVGMASIGYLAYMIYHEFQGKPVTYSDFLPFTAGYMVLIWVTWFCSKQFSYTKQICDEYEYKYALSKSYISYREEAKKLADAKQSVAIMISLLDSIIKNIAQSPVQNVKRDSHTPFTEVFNAVKDAGHAYNNSEQNKDKSNN